MPQAPRNASLGYLLHVSFVPTDNLRSGKERSIGRQLRLLRVRIINMGALKWISLGIMTVQNAITPLVFRYATTETSAENRYDTATSVMMAECIKLCLSLILVFCEESCSLKRTFGVIDSEILKKPKDTLKLGVPALLYFIQNQCLQVASANLPAAVFQVMYQGKTLVVALCSVVLLQKELTRARWLAIFIMGSGLAVVQLAKAEEKSQSSMANADEQSLVKGLMMVLIGCFCSGFAGVYFEKMMKKVTPGSKSTNDGVPRKPPSMWVRNAQLAFFTIVIGFLQMMTLGSTNSSSSSQRASILHGFTTKVWIMVINNAVGGLCVAFVIKYADNILKDLRARLQQQLLLWQLSLCLALPFRQSLASEWLSFSHRPYFMAAQSKFRCQKIGGTQSQMPASPFA